MQKQGENQRSYFIEAVDLMEMGRQILQSCVITQELGGVFPPWYNLSEVHHVLDVACGPGAWTLEAAEMHQQMHFTGIDIESKVIYYAQTRAWAVERPNVKFQVMDVTQPLQFEENTFDLIYARFLMGFMRRQDWPSLIKECLRVLRPGGTLLFTEGDTWVASQSPAIMKISNYLYQALWLAGQAFCSDGQGGIGVSPMLPLFLGEEGYEHVRVNAHVIDTSYGSRAYPALVQDTILLVKQLQPFLERNQVAKPEELDKLYHQVIEEVRRKAYRALWHITQVSGQKPFR